MNPYYEDESVTLWHGDSLKVLRTLPDQSVNCCVTSPPYYGLRDYGSEGQYGLEPTPAAYVETMRSLFAEVRRVLTDDGTLWLNVGDSYVGAQPGRNDAGRDIGGRGGNKLGSGNPGRQSRSRDRAEVSAPRTVATKNLLGIPWRTAFALQDDGWILRNAIVWNKPNAMPESVTDRLSTRHELIFLFSKSRRYWFDLDPIREPLIYPEAADGSRVFGGKNKASELQAGSSARRTGNTYGQRGATATSRGAVQPGNTMQRDPGPDGLGTNHIGRNPGDVWTIPTQPFPGSHFAVFPVEIPRRAIAAGCKPGGTVLDPFSGSGTTGLAAGQLGRKYVGIDLSPEYLDLSLRTRLAQTSLLDGEAS